MKEEIVKKIIERNKIKELEKKEKLRKEKLEKADREKTAAETLKRINGFFKNLPKGQYDIETSYYDENEYKHYKLSISGAHYDTNIFPYDYLTILRGKEDSIKIVFSNNIKDSSLLHDRKDYGFPNTISEYTPLDNLIYFESRLSWIEAELEKKYA